MPHSAAFSCSLPARYYHCAVIRCGKLETSATSSHFFAATRYFNTIKSWARRIDSRHERFLNVIGTIRGRPFFPQLVSCLEEATVALPIGRGALQGSTPSCYQWTNACAKGFVCEHASARTLPRSQVGDNAILALCRCPLSFTRMHVLALATICSITHRAAHARQVYRWQPDSAACAGWALSYASHRRTIIQHSHRICLGAMPSPPMFPTQ